MGETPLVNARHEAAVNGEDSIGTLIRVAGCVKRYRKLVALDGIDLEIRKGEIFGLIGPDGAGKSSLMKVIAGVLTYDAGSVTVFGVKLDTEANCERIKPRLGFMPQGLGLNLYADLSVDENINFFAALRLVPDLELAERKARLLAMTRLDRFRDRPMKHLSGGMKQKLGLVCTLIHEPELVILDEPTTGVDPVSRRDFWIILAELLQENSFTALVSTAYMDEAARFHRAALLLGGKVHAAGEPEAIRRLVPGSVAIFDVEDQVAARARLKARFSQVETLGSQLKVFAEGVDGTQLHEALQGALGHMPMRNLYTGEPDLEDVLVASLSRYKVGADAVNTPGPQLSPATRSANGVAIEAIELTRDFGAFRAVDQTSFRVLQGEIFGLLGANGAGKTTVIKLLTGIIRPTSGSGQVAGIEMRTESREIKKRIGYLSQSFSLYTDLTVIENIGLYAAIYGLSARETKTRIQWVVAMAGLSAHEKSAAGLLPMGMRQRLALGCALVHQPQVLFLDEPTSGVDPIGRRQLWDILFTLSREEGVAILVTTHYMSEAEHCDHLALMYAGRIVADASPARMKRDVESEAGRLLELTTTVPHRAVGLLRLAGYADAALFGTRIHLLSKNVAADIERLPALLLTESIETNQIVARPLSMEDVFVYRVGSLEDGDRKAIGAVT